MLNREALFELFTRRSSTAILMKPMALDDRIEFSKQEHVEIGAVLMISCKVRSSIRRAICWIARSHALNHPVLVPSAGATGGLILTEQLEAIALSWPAIQPGHKSNIQNLMGKEVCSRGSARGQRAGGCYGRGRSSARQRGETSKSASRWRTLPRVENVHLSRA